MRGAAKKFIPLGLAVFVLAAAAALLVGRALGWFSASKSHEQILPLTPFAVKTVVRFEGKAAAETGSLVEVNLTDPAAENYLGKLRVSVEYSGDTEAMLRLHVTHLWEQNGASPSRANIKFAYDAARFVDNVAADGCYYYCDRPAYPAVGTDAFILPPTREKAAIDFITGLNQSVVYESSLRLTLLVEAELIASNRYQQFWGGLPAVT